ncbi:hypothetical protein CBL_00131 [Carabus blaptoides fortunei]
MKTAVIFVIFAIGLASAFWHTPADPLACQNPDQLPGTFCGFIPPGCLQPVCAGDTISAPKWFRSSCHLASYNLQCRSSYRRTFEGSCNAADKPAPSLVPCPLPTIK